MEQNENMKLHLDALYPLFCDAETTAWKSCDAHPTGNSTVHEDDLPKETVGSQLLRHGNTVQNIHAYFMNFEQRRCCINLVAGKTTLTNIRVIPVAREDCDGYLESRSSSHSLLAKDRLSHKEFHLYCEAILCALFPILGAPSPPNEHTPPDSPPSEPRTPPIPQVNKGIASIHVDVDGTSNNDDEFLTSLVKEEQLAELVRNVFGISQERAAQYDAMIFNLHGRQKPAKILAEELVRQLSQLENNCVPFYEPDQFLNSHGYREWQKMERQHLTELITKFWQGPLPSLRGGRVGPALPNKDGHGHYARLMFRLIRYNHQHFPPSELHPTFLSTDAHRLLKEFGLRYGIGEQYRRLVYLEYVATHFLQEVWYVRHANAALCEMLRTLPCTPSRLVMVNEEKKILEKCCQCFLLECENSLRKVRHIFPGFCPHVSIGLLLELLRNTLKISSFLSGEPHPPIRQLLESWFQNGFTTEYEQHKLMECYDLRLDPSRSLLSPRLLYRIIIKVRDSVRSYRNEYQAIFKSYFEIHKMAAQCFYKLLMSDVRVMCEDIQISHEDNELSLQMVSFAYRLNQLDRDWVLYVPIEDQTWRKAYLPEVLNWVNVVQGHATSLILQSVASDKFTSLEIEEREVLSGMVPFCPKFAKSLSPSQMSAFSETFHHTSQESYLTVPNNTRTSRSNRLSREGSRETLSQKRESLRKRPFSTVQLESTPNIWQRETSSVPDIRIEVKSPQTVQNERSRQRECNRRFSLGTVHEQPSVCGSLSKSMSSPEIHALMQRCEDIQKIQDQSLLRSADDMSIHGSRLSKDQGFGRYGSLPTVGQADFLRSSDNFSGRTFTVDSVESLDRKSTGKKRKVGQNLEPTNVKIPVIVHGQVQGTATGGLSDTLPGQTEQGQCIRYDEPFADQGEGQGHGNHLENESKVIQETLYPAVQEVRNAITTHVTGHTGASGINSMVMAAHRALNESGANDFPKLSRQSSTLSDIFKEVRAKACLGGWISPDRRYVLPFTSSPLSLETSMSSFEVISGKLMMSSSVIDVVCLLNRITNFMKTVSEVIYPLNLPENTQLRTKTYEGANSAAELRELREEIAIGRKLLLDKLRRMMFHCVTVYSQNMLAMDMCSLTEEVGRQLAGTKLLKDLHAGHECGHIWGCRHSANGHVTPKESHSCYTYKNTNPRYLASKYEPIDKQMCIRINNLCELFDVLDHVEIQVDQTLSFYEMKKELEELHLLGAEDCQEEETSLKKDQVNYAEGPSDTSDFFWRLKGVLRATRNTLLNILTFRINLFIKDALSVLLNLQLPLVSIAGRLTPLSEFLSRHLEVLQKWLVHDAYLEAAGQLWKLIAQNFEEEEGKILELKEFAHHHAILLLEAIAHLIKVYANLEPELDIEGLSNAMAKVSFKLEVHTLATAKLCSIAMALRIWHSNQLQESLAEYFMPVNEIIKKLRWCLHGDRKSFTGQELFNWLLSNPQFFSMSDATDGNAFGNVTPLTDSEHGILGDPELKRRAVTLCQQLLDSSIICPLLEERKSSNKLENSISLPGKVLSYPNVVECVSVGSSNISGLMGVQSIVSGRGYDTDEESYDADTEAKSDRRQTSEASSDKRQTSEVKSDKRQTSGNETAKKDQSFSSYSSKTDKQYQAGMMQPLTESTKTIRGQKSSLGQSDLQGNLSLVSPRLDTGDPKKLRTPDVSGQGETNKYAHTPVSETTSNSSAFLFQNSLRHFYYLHSLASVFGEFDPCDLGTASFLDIYIDNGVDYDFVMKILKTRQKYDTQAKKFLKTFDR